jgi:bacterioferritin
MKGDPGVLDQLNNQLTNELTAINQYFLHARTLQHWGFAALGKKEYEESIIEMKHADKLIDRILMLDGLPNLQRLNPLMIGESVQEMLQADLKLEITEQQALKEGIRLSEEVRDYVSRDMFREILAADEGHIEWLETQLELIDKIGLPNYLESQMGHEED